MALLAERDKFTKAFSEKMLTFARRRPVGYADRSTVKQLIDASDTTITALAVIHAIIDSGFKGICVEAVALAVTRPKQLS